MIRLALATALVLAVPARAQEGWREPPDDVVALLEAPPTPRASVAPDGRHLLLVERPAMPALYDVLRPWVGLAGLRVDVELGARHRTTFETGLTLVELASGAHRTVPVPDGARIASLSWSPGGRRFAYTTYEAEGVFARIVDVAAGAELGRVGPLVAVTGSGFEWLPDGERLLVWLRPAATEPPERPRVPPGPIVQATGGEVSAIRTYQDLLDDEHEADLFDAYLRASLALFDGRTAVPIGAAGTYASARPSPDGTLLFVTRLARPYSFQLPYWRFPRVREVWSLAPESAGDVVAALPPSPLAETVPLHGVEEGPRMLRWAPNEPATLVWAEALDGGDPENEVEHRDRWLRHPAPFDRDPEEIARVEHRARGLDFLAAPGPFLTSEYDRDRRWTRLTLHGLPESGGPIVLEDRSVRDRYGDPGDLVRTPNAYGLAVVALVDGWVFRAGRGAGPDGDRPFLSRTHLLSGATETLWRSDPACYEAIVDVFDCAGGPRFVTRHESADEPPNYRLRSAGREAFAALTDFGDPTPALRGIQKELVKYERADGVPLSATLYVPADREPGERLPLFVWAYPIEFLDAGTAGQVSGSPHRFTRIAGTSPLLLATQGYAVMDGATMPVIGDPETVNDTFVEQIVQAAEAAIRKATELGVADPERVAIGGHSYGAFMTANLLAHSDLFRAGVARSGAYNRTLTPFGFQSERRTLWDAPELYFAVSPFLHAEKIDEPLLLIHGELDNNSGTFPIQSDRMFHALRGNGGIARYVKLPGESHGYRGRESVLHVAAETIAWLDEHVKGAAARPVEAAVGR